MLSQKTEPNVITISLGIQDDPDSWPSVNESLSRLVGGGGSPKMESLWWKTLLKLDDFKIPIFLETTNIIQYHPIYSLLVVSQLILHLHICVSIINLKHVHITIDSDCWLSLLSRYKMIQVWISSNYIQNITYIIYEGCRLPSPILLNPYTSNSIPDHNLLAILPPLYPQNITKSTVGRLWLLQNEGPPSGLQTHLRHLLYSYISKKIDPNVHQVRGWRMGVKKCSYYG